MKILSKRSIYNLAKEAFWTKKPNASEKGNGNLLQYSFLPEESHGQKNLQAISPKDHRESDMTERLSTCAS